MHARRLLLALDQGTTSSRAMVYDAQGRVVGSAQRPFPQLYPRPGLVEHDPAALWTTQREAAAAAIVAAGATARDLAAIGIANQRETTLVWERATGRTLGNAIVWQDRRTAAACERLRAEGLEPVVAERTGLRLDPYFAATKLQWLLEHHDGARERAARGELCFGTVDSWLLFHLTGGRLHATDATNASRTLLFDVHRGDWDDELLRVFGVPRAMLPAVVDSSARLAEVDASLPFAGVPIAGVAGDQQAALFGQLCHRPGEAKLTYGTGCFLLQHTGTQAVRSQNRLLTTIASRIGGVTTYALEGAVFVGGAVVQWLRDELGLVRSAQELDELAASVPDAGGVFLVPAFAGLGAPHWDPRARGAILGLTRGSGRAQLCRAALEGIALQCADLLDCMRADSGLSLAELRVDGGATNSAPLLQIQADLLGLPLVRPDDVETTARGAAWLAGLAVGFWPDAAALARLPCGSSRVEPRGDAARSQALRDGWQRAVARARDWSRD